MREGEGGLPTPVLIFNVDCGQCHLNTCIADRTDIGHHGATSGNEWQLYFEEQVLRGLLVDIDATVDAAAEETEVDTEVIFG